MPISSGSSDRDTDPYLWLEEVEGADALAWVAERNRATHAALAEGQPGFDALRARLRATFDAEDRIPHLRKLGDRYYNFWQDEENPRGVWRRTTLDEYRKPAPDWEVVIDFDALGRAEGERWMFAGAPVLVPGYDRALVKAHPLVFLEGCPVPVHRAGDVSGSLAARVLEERLGDHEGPSAGDPPGAECIGRDLA